MKKHSLYMEKIDAKLTQYNAKLAHMKGKAAEVQVDMKLEYLDQVKNLEKRRDNFVTRHDQLKGASGDKWKDIKVGTEEIWNELEDTFNKAVTRFK